MATVDIQNNPVVPMVGSLDSDAVIISSEQTDQTDFTTYQIENLATTEVININNGMNGQAGGTIISVDHVTLKVTLESRTKYRVRTQSQYGPWSAWVNFKTRDKRYQSPDAITTLTDDTDSSSQTQGTKLVGNTVVAQGGNRTIVVTNNAKATEVDNTAVGYNMPRNWGPTTVTNIDTIYSDGQLQRTGTVRIEDGTRVSVLNPVAYTTRGATVVNVPAGKNSRINYTNRGATIDTRG